MKNHNLKDESEKWLDAVRHRLSTHEMSPPEGVWESIERRTATRRSFATWRTTAVAAVATIIIGGLASLIILNDDETELVSHNRQTETSFSTSDNSPGTIRGEKTFSSHATPQKVTPCVKSSSTYISIKEESIKTTNSNLSVDLHDGNIETHEMKEEPKSSAAVLEDNSKKNGKNEVNAKDQEEYFAENWLEPYEWELPLQEKTNCEKGWSIGLYASSSTTASPSGSDLFQSLGFGGSDFGDVNYFDDLTSSGGEPPSEEDFDNKDDNTDSKNSQNEQQFINRAPTAFQYNEEWRKSRRVMSADHHAPLTVGMTARYSFNNRLSAETGVTYTLLTSDITSAYEGNIVRNGRQTLHYVGIPLKANYSLWNYRKFGLYLSAGALLEWMVDGKYTESPTGDNDRYEENFDSSPAQLSLNAAVGMQFNFTRRFGIYAEPGASYYFDDCSSLTTIYKEHPWNFTLRMGLRINLNQ